jgi:hypothetical protein
MCHCVALQDLKAIQCAHTLNSDFPKQVRIHRPYVLHMAHTVAPHGPSSQQGRVLVGASPSPGDGSHRKSLGSS